MKLSSWHLARVVVAIATLLGAGYVVAQAQEKPAEEPRRQAPSRPAEPQAPAPPQDPAAAKAYAVLDQHCARCHQTGRLKVPRPAQELANILDLPAIARNPALVRPGTPDGSRLYIQMVAREMPYDTFHDLGGDEPTPDEIQAVRDWIQALPRVASGGCGDRAPVAAATVDAAIAAALEAQPAERRRDLRFVTLTHLYNACVPDATLEAYRQAVTRTLNSLSWSAVVARPEPVDDSGTVLKIDLAALGWVAGHWDQLAQVYPYAAHPGSLASTMVKEQTGSALPAVRADWLAATALRSPLYQGLLGLPTRHADLQRVLNFDVESDLKAGHARRAGFRDSRVVKGNRMVSRHALKSGVAWIAYDFAASGGRQSIFEHPVGPTAGAGGRQPFRPDAMRTMFTLPNGFLAFIQHDGRGDRSEASPAGLERDPARWTAGPAAGIGCMGCHASGALRVRDEVRLATEADRTAPKEVRDAVAAAHVSQDELETLFERDVARLRTVLADAGIDPDLLVDGLDPVTALARAYTGPADLRRAAADLSATEAEFRVRLATVGGADKLSAARLRQGVVPRADLDRLLAGMIAGAPVATAAATTGGTPAPEARPGEAKPGERRDLGLVLWSERDTYKSGELAVFHARADADCHLTLVSIDEAGKATVLFPNEFEQANLLTAGKELRLPGEAAPYQFRLKEKGRETLVGVCTVIAKSADGIQHDYERQRFTMLGNWRNFLHQALTEDAGERRQQADSRQPDPRPRARRRTRGRPADAKAEPVKGREQQARTAITYEVQ